MSPVPSARKLRILMLHGYTQSGHLFSQRTARLQKFIQKSLNALPLPSSSQTSGVEFIYPTGPIKLSAADLPQGFERAGDAYGWWRFGTREDECERIEESFAAIAETLRTQGPVDGIIGFSQGAAVAAMVAALLEPGRKDFMSYPESFAELQHPPLQFVLCYSGFLVTNAKFAGFFQPKIQTPALFLWGSLDTIVDEKASLALAACCENASVISHPGAHTVPSSQKEVEPLIQFIRGVYAEEEPKADQEEEDVREMELPF